MTLPHDNAYVTTPGVPHSREAEEAVVGSVLIAPEILPMLRGIIASPDEFYIHRHRWLWDIYCGMDARNVAIDLLTVTEELERIGKLQEMGGRGFLTSIVNQVPTTMNAEHYARIIHAHHVRRRMITAANTVAQVAYDESIQIEDVASTSIEAVQSAANGLIGGRAQDAGRVAGDYLQEVYANAEKEPPGIATGLYDLDLLLGGGVQNDDFIIIAGRPGRGKSGLLGTIAAHASRSHHVGLFSMEMSNRQTMARLIAHETGIETRRALQARLGEDEWARLVVAVDKISGAHLWIDDTMPLSFVTLRAKAVQKRAQGELDLLLIDYLQLLEGPGKELREVVTNNSRNLKGLAKELHIPVIAACQLNRESEKTGDKEPQVYHLGESGAIERDADIVALLWEEGEDVQGVEMVPVKLKVGKHRNGATGIVNLFREAKTTRFVSPERMSRGAE